MRNLVAVAVGLSFLAAAGTARAILTNAAGSFNVFLSTPEPSLALLALAALAGLTLLRAGAARVVIASRNMRSEVASLAFAVLVAACAGTARSSSLIVEDEWRWVRAGGAPSGVYVESDGSPHFTASVDGSCCSLHAEQDSTLSEDGFFGSGSFSASSEASTAAYSYLNVVFRVSETATYVLQGSFPSQQGAGQFNSTYDTIFLEPEFSLRLLLVPEETYAFFIQGSNQPYRDSSAGWSFTLTVPEPAVQLLSLAALAVITPRRAVRPRSRPRPRASLPAGR